MLLWCSDSTQCVVHDKSTSISQCISGKSRNLQKLIRYLGRIVTSTFIVGIGGCSGCGGWFPSWSGSSCGSRGVLSGIFPTFFGLYLNHLY